MSAKKRFKARAAGGESLFPAEELTLERIGSPGFTGASTGDRLFEQRPELYRICVHLLAQGSGIREIMRITGLHHMTVLAVRKREGAAIDTLRRGLASGFFTVAELGQELLIEAFTHGTIHGEPVKLKVGEIAMTTGISTDKGQLMSGGVTARVEKVELHQVADELEAFLANLPMADGEIIEMPHQTDQVPGNKSPIALPDRDAEIVLAPSPDEQSGVPVTSYSVDVAGDTSGDTDPIPAAVKRPARKKGGRGSKARPRDKTATDRQL